MNLLPYKSIYPKIEKTAFIAPNATIVGDVVLSAYVSIWYATTLRGDVNYIRIGESTNIQDNSVLHVTRERFPLILGARITVGHAAILHGCILEDECFIGMGATVLDGAVVETHAMVGAGALVPPGMRVPSGTIVAGIPAKPLRKLRPEEIEDIAASADRYKHWAQEHKALNQTSS